MLYLKPKGVLVKAFSSHFIFIFNVLLLLIFWNFSISKTLAQSSSDPSHDVTGKWQGIVKMPGGAVDIEIRFDKDENNGLKGTIDMPSEGVESARLLDIELQADSLFFRVMMSPSGGPLFRGKIEPNGNAIYGSTERGDVLIPITLARQDSKMAHLISEDDLPKSTKPSDHPFGNKLITEDISQFWEAFERAAPDFEAGEFKKIYFSKGTQGLKTFLLRRVHTAEKLAEQIREYPEFYASIRSSTERIEEMEPEIRASFFALKYLYPEAVFPDVYFLIGRMTTGGMPTSNSLLIGAEMYSLSSSTSLDKLTDWHRDVLSPVEEIPNVVAHELVHYQQQYPTTNTLLAESITEGAADFIAELMTGERLNDHLHSYGNPREMILWEEFKKVMFSEDFTGWLYDGNDLENRPADLGYWMGYQIVEAYYNQETDKLKAVQNILEINDFEVFLQQSTYAEKIYN